MLKRRKEAKVRQTNNAVCGSGFIAKTLTRFAQLFENELYCERYASNNKLLQCLDPRVKVVVVLAFMIYANFISNIAVLIGVAVVAMLYAKASGLPLGSYTRRTWLYLPVIISLFSLPGATNIFSGGSPAFYLVPAGALGTGNGLFFSKSGLLMALRIGLRTGDSLSFAFLLLMTTKWSDITGALRRMHLPDVFVAVLNMAYRYIFLIAEVGTAMIQARHLRTVGKIKAASDRKYVSSSVGQLFIRVHQMSETIYDAMRLRGYDGNIAAIDTMKTDIIDWLFLLINGIIIMILIIGGHIF